MIVTHLSLRDFRNYAEAEVALSPGTNLFVGRNGQGKTNLVESLVYLSTLSSHRVSGEQALIRAGHESAIIRTRLHHAGRDLLAEVQINKGSANRAQVNRAQIKPRELPRYIRTVLFAPEDLAIVRGDPSGRRRFIDQVIVALSPRYAGIMADYDRVLKQRNTLLKSLRGVRGQEAQQSTLEIWDDKLVTLGSSIIAERASIVARLSSPVADAYARVVGDDHRPTIALRSSVDGSDAEDDDNSDRAGSDVGGYAPAEVDGRFRVALAARRRAELDRGITLVGPHRDDLDLGLNGLPVKGYASHGESWSFALALKLGSAELLREDSALGDPVLILDDVFAELDRGRRERLASAIAGFEQVLITAAVIEDIPEQMTLDPVFVRAGAIVSAADVAHG